MLIDLLGSRESGGFGLIRFGDITHVALFTIAGLERRWGWDPGDDNRMNYGFVMDVDGAGKYYDFTNVKPVDGVRTTKPKGVYKCIRQ